MANNPVHHQRSKHIDVKYHWIRDKILDKTVYLQYVATSDQRADVLTKVVDGVLFHKHLPFLVVDIVV